MTSRTKTCCATVTPRGSDSCSDSKAKATRAQAPQSRGAGAGLRCWPFADRFPAGPSRFKPRKANHPTRLIYPSGHAPDLSTTARGRENVGSYGPRTACQLTPGRSGQRQRRRGPQRQGRKKQRAVPLVFYAAVSAASARLCGCLGLGIGESKDASGPPRAR